MIIIFVNAVKGISALQLARDLGLQYKTAIVLAHNIRESLMEQLYTDVLTGEVHMDGAYVNSYIDPRIKNQIVSTDVYLLIRVTTNAVWWSCVNVPRKPEPLFLKMRIKHRSWC